MLSPRSMASRSSASCSTSRAVARSSSAGGRAPRVPALLPNTNILETRRDSPARSVTISPPVSSSTIATSAHAAPADRRTLSQEPRIRPLLPRLGWRGRSRCRASARTTSAGRYDAPLRGPPTPRSATQRPAVRVDPQAPLSLLGSPVEESLPGLGGASSPRPRLLQRWVKHCNIRAFQEDVIRSRWPSAPFEDTGAILPLPPPPIPESPTAAAALDYRFCWLRDAIRRRGLPPARHFETQSVRRVSSSTSPRHPDLALARSIDRCLSYLDEDLTAWPGLRHGRCGSQRCRAAHANYVTG